MNSFRNLLTLAQERKLRALDSWHRALENCSLRMDCPDAYHEELLRQADEMDRQGIVSWEEWRDEWTRIRPICVQSQERTTTDLLVVHTGRNVRWNG